MKNKYANGAGKGDRPRAVKGALYRRNYDMIFRPKQKTDYRRHIFGKWRTMK